MDNVMLIVDDVELNREILKVLFHNNFRIMEAETGDEALEILEGCQGHIDIVLLDLMMPGMSGFELLQRKADLDYMNNVPIVVITSSGNQEDQIEAFNLGASDFITKPFIPEIVVSRVNNVMASNRRLISMELETQKLKIKSELDEMTGLYNKSTTEFTMHETLKKGGGKLDVLMIIDIDNFKTVNDTSGHQAGDHVIKIIANLISGHFRKTDIVGRIGGDEFCVMMVDVPSMSIARDKVNELIQLMRYKPNLAIPEYVTLSIGMASNNKLDANYRELFKKADQALYMAKDTGKARFCEYGIEPVNLDDDERPAVILFSNNRSVCSTVHALIPERIHIIEVLHFDNLRKLSERDKKRVAFMYVDVTDLNHGTETFWNELKTIDWIDMSNVFAICQEGVVSQYMDALKNGVADMFTAPIDHATFRRRTQRQLEKLGLLDEEPVTDERVLDMQE